MHRELCSNGSVLTQTQSIDSRRCSSYYHGTNLLSVDYPVHNLAVDVKSGTLTAENSGEGKVYLLLRKSGSGTCGDKKAIQCITFTNETIQLNVTQKDTPQMACIMEEDRQGTLFPLNCRSYRMPVINPVNSGWLSREDMLYVLPAVCVAYLLAMGLGLGLSYLLVSKYPQLLTGAKNVVIIRHPDRRGCSAIVLVDRPASNRRNPE